MSQLTLSEHGCEAPTELQLDVWEPACGAWELKRSQLPPAPIEFNRWSCAFAIQIYNFTVGPTVTFVLITAVIIQFYSFKKNSYIKLEVWANAQPDGRPAKYRWRPLFNAAV